MNLAILGPGGSECVAWPPVPKPGNLFDQSAARKAGGKTPGIDGYDDGHPDLAFVASYKPDWHGAYDLAGNVWEWVDDDFGGDDDKTRAYGTCRGGSWMTKEQQELLASYRHTIPADSRIADVGFRVILAGPRAARDDE